MGLANLCDNGRICPGHWGCHMRACARIIIATGLLTIGALGVPATCSAAPNKLTVQIRVVDQDGAPRVGANVVACPVTAGQQDCSNAVSGLSNPSGRTTLKLDASVTYGVFSFVSNPEPPWACPG